MSASGDLTKVAGVGQEPEEQEQEGRRRGMIFFLLIPLLLGGICLWSFFANVTLSSAESFIPAGLHSSGLANYGPDEMQSPIRGLQIRIIEGVIRDRDPEAADAEQRATDVVKALETPIPTVTPQPGAPTQTPRPTDTRTPSPPTIVPMSSATSAPTNTPDGSPSPSPTITPSRTATASRTPTPTRTPTNTKTSTPGPCKVPPVLEIESPIDGSSFSWMDELPGEAKAYDPDNVDPDDCLPIGDFDIDNGEGIASATPAPPGVEFKIEWFNGIDWVTVHEQDQFAVRYCTFTGTGACLTWDLGTLLWPPQDPDGSGPATPLPPESIQSGTHRLKARAWDDEGVHGEWEYVQITIDVDPTPTLTPSITPTPSNTPTPSPTPTIDPCTQVTLAGFNKSGSEMWLTLSNGSPISMAIEQIEVSWTFGADLSQVKLGGSSIWSGDLPSPATVDATGAIGAGLDQELRFVFESGVNSSGYSVTVHFTGGCDTSFNN